MELKMAFSFFSVVALLWLWVISDKLSEIVKLLEVLVEPKVKEDISKLADDLFVAEYNKYRLEAARRAK